MEKLRKTDLNCNTVLLYLLRNRNTALNSTPVNALQNKATVY